MKGCAFEDSLMRRHVICLLLPFLCFAAAAQAQSSAPAAGAQSQPNPFDAPPARFVPYGGGATQQQPREPPCMTDFTVLRDDAEKKARAIRDASTRRVDAKEACRLFNALTAVEAKMVKFAVANAASCGIPQQIVDQIKGSHKNTDGMRGRVCAAAAQARPAAPTLGDALSTTPIPNSSNIRRGGGTYDTLTGTPLGRQ
jgi:hypothetical protein